ncbi:hypothetical protein LCGC14_3018390 [marine sediment metagenome]|uniref:Uncharacterized protein n=1 Tax=marine sediment metagenome TaxID=412755 RepID=A0A0F8ZM62_9ZZZZ
MIVENIEQFIQLAQLVVVVGGGFYFTGRITKTLETLTTVTGDHEDRLRVIEQKPARVSQ